MDPGGMGRTVRPDLLLRVAEEERLRTRLIAQLQDPALYVLISYVHVDPPGRDVRPEGGEFVVLTNVGANIADVSGWTLGDAAGHRITLPPHRYIGPGQRLRVRVALGTDTPNDVFAGRSSAILNNLTGDQLRLADATGRVVHVVSWDAP